MDVFFIKHSYGHTVYGNTMCLLDGGLQDGVVRCGLQWFCIISEFTETFATVEKFFTGVSETS